MNKEFEKINKLRSKIDYKEYHLYTKIDGDKITWALYRKFDNWEYYMSDDNKAILTSEKNTIKELKDFIKKHHKLKENGSFFRLMLAYLLVFVAIFNIFYKSTVLRGFIWGAESVILICSFYDLFVSNHNYKISLLELKELYKEYKEWEENASKKRNIRKTSKK